MGDDVLTGDTPLPDGRGNRHWGDGTPVPIRKTGADREALRAMSDEGAEAGTLSDPDTPPPTDAGLRSAGAADHPDARAVPGCKAPLTKQELRRGKPGRAGFAAMPRRPVVLVLDSLKCGHNIGTILRLADALLVRTLYICGNTLVPPNRKISAGSRGAERWVPWKYEPEAAAVVGRLKGQGHFVVAAEMTATSVPFHEVSYGFPLCLVVGREFDGVSPEVLGLADALAHLPIHGMANSINVAAATAVFLYEIERRLPAATSPPRTVSGEDCVSGDPQSRSDSSESS